MIERSAILYIEDNLDNQRLVRRVLEARGYEMLIAPDGPSGLAAARTARPALILVDINIPGLDGCETTTRLRSLNHLRETPIVALTADGRTETRDRSLAAGCDGYILKPIDVRRLPVQVEEFIAGRRDVLPAADESAVLRDYAHKLTERLEQQVAELATANEELKQLDRLKSQFLAMLSHELRTPLTSILGYLELFERGTLGALSGMQGEAVGVITRNAHTLSRKLNSLLYLQEMRSSQLKRTTVNVHDLVRRALAEYQPRAGAAGVDLRGQLQLVAPIGGDAFALDHAVRAVIDNAVKFTPAQGRVLVTLVDEPGRVVLRVRDNGRGIPADQHEKVFQPFYKLDTSLAETDAGVGIGLAIVRHVVDAHGGHVVLWSEPGKGSAFTLVLPRV